MSTTAALDFSDRWMELLRSYGAPLTPSLVLFAELERLYTERRRFYHNFRHVGEVLDTVARLEPLAVDPRAIELAVWFHDAVYDSRATDNEEQSAQLARRTLGSIAIPEETVEKVARLILYTQHHSGVENDVDGQILLDADLAILGASEERYAEYMEAIRQEYSWVPTLTFHIGRRGVLEHFLRRPRIYHTPAVHAELETTARRNIAGELAGLS